MSEGHGQPSGIAEQHRALAKALALRHLGEPPLLALFVREMPPGSMDCPIGTGSWIDLVAMLLGRIAALRHRLRRDRNDGIQVVAFYSRRVAIFTWHDGDTDANPNVEENTLPDTRVYVGHQMLRLAGQTWLLNSNDRQHLLKSLRGTRWQRQLAETAA